MERSKLDLCKYCRSGNISRNGYRINKKGKLQRYVCLDCNRQFTSNFGFEKTRVDPSTITGAMQMYFTGMSVRDIVNHYEMMGIKISYRAVYNWIAKYSKMVEKYLNEIIPRTTGRAWIRADEVRRSGQLRPDFVAYDYEKDIAISVEIESYAEVKTHKGHIIFNMEKWRGLGFDRCHVWSTTDLITEVRNGLDEGKERVETFVVDIDDE